MTTRLIAIVMLVLLVGFIALLASVSYFVRDPLPVVSPRTGALVSAENDGPGVQIVIDAGYGIQIRIEGAGAGDPSDLRLSLRPEAEGAHPIAVVTERLEDGTIVATGQLTRPGRWALQISGHDWRMTQSFIVQE